jgi:hypothetical protein
MKTEELNEKYRAEGEDFYVSFNKATGKKIKDIYGYFSDPFGGGTSFGMSRIVFEDDSITWVDGEHDWAYVMGPFLENLDEVEHDDED